MTLVTEPARPEVQAIFLKAHLKMQRVGMKHSTLTKTDLLRKATAITGTKYSSKTIDLAIADLQKIIDAACSPKGGV